MSATLRRLGIALAALLITLLGAGCGGTKHNQVLYNLTHSDADDLMQQFGMMIALDHGGWLNDVHNTLTAVPATGAPTFSKALTIAGMNYSMVFNFTTTHGDSIGTLAAWADTDTVEDAEATTVANGQMLADTTFNGFFHHSGDPITAAGFHSTPDTIGFTGFTDDSMFVAFVPSYRAGTRYVETTGFVDFDFQSLRDPSAHPFPIAGTLEAILFSDLLNSYNISDSSGQSIDATIDLTFDGTQTPLVGIFNELESSAPKFWYRVDLKTGKITRQ